MSDLFAYERLMNSAEELLEELRKLPPGIVEVRKIEWTAIQAYVFAQQKVIEMKDTDGGF